MTTQRRRLACVGSIAVAAWSCSGDRGSGATRATPAVVDSAPATAAEGREGTAEPPVSTNWPNHPFAWVRFVDGPYGVSAGAVDSAGGESVWAAGFFAWQADLDPGAGVDLHAAEEGLGLLVLGLDGEGRRTAAVTVGLIAPHDVDMRREVALAGSRDGSVTVATTFSGRVDLDPGPRERIAVARGAEDVLVLALDRRGGLRFGVTVGGPMRDEVTGLAVDEAGHVVIGGSFEGTAYFGRGAQVHSRHSHGRFDGYVASFDSSGEVGWVASFGGEENLLVYDVATSPGGGAVAVGAFRGEVDLDTGPATDLHGGGPSRNGFVLVLDERGRRLWARSIAGRGDLALTRARTAEGGRVLVLGGGRGAIDLNPGAGVDERVLGSRDRGGAFLIALDASGAYEWGRVLGEMGAQDFFLGPAGGLVITGSFSGTVDFDPGPEEALRTATGDHELFVLALDAEGSFERVETAAGSVHNWGTSIAAAHGAAFVAGTFVAPSGRAGGAERLAGFVARLDIAGRGEP